MNDRQVGNYLLSCFPIWLCFENRTCSLAHLHSCRKMKILWITILWKKKCLKVFRWTHYFDTARKVFRFRIIACYQGIILPLLISTTWYRDEDGDVRIIFQSLIHSQFSIRNSTERSTKHGADPTSPWYLEEHFLLRRITPHWIMYTRVAVFWTGFLDVLSKQILSWKVSIQSLVIDTGFLTLETQSVWF